MELIQKILYGMGIVTLIIISSAILPIAVRSIIRSLDGTVNID